jgi:tetratricopeptide (TPR) repeat protein
MFHWGPTVRTYASQCIRQTVALVILCMIVAGCVSTSRTAYAPLSESKRNPLEAQRLTQQAAALIDSDRGEAEALLREALVADLYHGPAHNNLGIIHLERGELYEAANEFEWARKLMPGHPDPRLNLAITLEKAGRTDEALKAYQTTLDVYPGYIPAIEAITRLMVRQGTTLDGDEHSNDSWKELETSLKEIALRGSTEKWRTWAAERLAKASK